MLTRYCPLLQTLPRSGKPQFFLSKPFLGPDDTYDHTHVKFNFEDREPYKHLETHRVVDGVTRARIDSKTTLAALYDPKGSDDPSIDNKLIKHLATTVEPRVLCQLETSHGKLYPPSLPDSQCSYQIKVTYSNLFLAPVLRLECHFVKPTNRRSPFLTLGVDFHFNEYIHGENTEISSYTHTEDGIIKFWTGRATCSGFNLIASQEASLTAKDQEVINVLRSFLEPNTRHHVTLHLDESELSSSQKRHLDQIRFRLPGGSGFLLPSIGGREYAAFGGTMDGIWAKKDGMMKPAELLSGSAPHPMVPLECGPTFSTMKEALVQLAYSAVVSDAEAYESLRLWAAIPHRAQVFTDKDFIVLGVNFEKFDRLGGKDSDLQFRLPRDLACSFVLVRPGSTKLEVDGFLMTGNPGLPRHDAFFRITSHKKATFAHMASVESRKCIVKCKPHYSSFTYNSQLETIRELQLTDNERWRDILLNQRHDKLGYVDLTAGVNPAKKEKADRWIRNWRPWNPEQLAVIEGVTAAKGGMSIVMGPAATGKTLLQQALAIYFYALDFHVLAVAPANDNANKFARDLLEAKIELPWLELDWLEDLSFNRLFPSSREIPVDEMSEKQAYLRKVGHTKGDTLPFPEFLLALGGDTKEKGAHREYGIVEAVIKAAEEKKYVLHKTLQSEDGAIISRDYNAWDVLRTFMSEYRAGTLDLANMWKMRQYRLAYRACKGQIVGLNRLMITTTGNVRSREMLQYWFSPESEYGLPRKGVIVLVDEAAKDLEINVWSAIVCWRWSDWVQGVFLFGDDKQLQPPNTSAKGETQFNYFSDRLDIPLPNRLVQEGYPCHFLLEQRRMHSAISSFPNRKIYGGKLRNGPDMNVTINEQMPGLRNVLVDIIAEEITNPAKQDRFRKIVSDADLRRHYVEVKGTRVPHESTKSMIVHEHIDVFFNKIFPKLREYFRSNDKSMNKHVMIICGYNFARYEYQDRFKDYLARNPSLTTQDIPRVLSVDSSQGDESFMVFLDGSYQHGDVVGFMGNEHRYNVAVTRAKGVLWIIGGDMRHRYKRSRPRALNLATEYKLELDAAGQTHRFS
ncbi:hypothetical protein LTR37_021127 [Vermiconidia calcicola]|uniref:Uncharacterized protein n=1 Tax=Vermiconidia calcicola TaxID=1690605 RepID=A0ACC3MAN6_9PEZI|nr:hypothetical protein LTR37_021127 [Vermiconidia calcicola]